jgi:hypothetical protein
MRNENDIQRLYSALIKKYPNVQIGVDQDSEGNPIIDIDSEETTFYIVQKPNGKFSINAVWSGDEKGRKNLDAASMVKALAGIPGMANRSTAVPLPTLKGRLSHRLTSRVAALRQLQTTMPLSPSAQAALKQSKSASSGGPH